MTSILPAHARPAFSAGGEPSDGSGCVRGSCRRKRKPASGSARASTAPIGRGTAVCRAGEFLANGRGRLSRKQAGATGVILDLQRFQAQGQPRWNKLESLLVQLESRPDRLLKPGERELLQELYAQTAADLNRVTHGALAPELRQYLERLVARAYAELYYARPTRSELWQPRRWLRIFIGVSGSVSAAVPLFRAAVLITILGCALGGLAVRYDPGVRGCSASCRLPAQSEPARASRGGGEEPAFELCADGGGVLSATHHAQHPGRAACGGAGRDVWHRDGLAAFRKWRAARRRSGSLHAARLRTVRHGMAAARMARSRSRLF